MKLLWIAHFIPYPPKGGMLLRSYNLLKQLTKEFQVDVIALARPDTMRDMYESFDDGLMDARNAMSEFCNDLVFVETQIGKSRMRDVFIATKSLLPGPPYSVRWFSSRAFARSLASQLSSKEYDLIHVDTISLAQFLTFDRAVPLVLDHHNIESDMLQIRAQRERNIFRKCYFQQEAGRLRKYEKRMCPHFDLHITCSRSDSDRLREIESSLDVTEVPNGVDIEYFRPNWGVQKTEKLIFVGGQGWYPNRDAMEFFATNIWPRISSRHEGISFELIGRSPSQSVLELARMDSRFHVHGFVDDIRSYMNEASVYVCPIRDGGGTKLKILDALAMGKAIVAHPCAVEGIDVSDGVNILLAESAEDFDRCIESFLADPGLRERFERAARRLAVSKYSYDSIGRDMRARYSYLVAH